ncbi:hypothetical protein CLAFUW4_13436 [Fulvia fulva]|uniref:Uncharacterized protein n=1 Tax=Passalora fulva TaxID=5499 RepID=A0A9Q8PKK6_PASFU|nr:uncharacterized protein CLAFUR5_13290 [Fulvia fulva]KAK4612157.1 hypothetical protein CLAFUR4_13439 [Fulvia fulva]KAK4613160.1 hypothetical protein CLAFUR0_13447 [Fulvia fulva]UJO24094.1 hypothetical protein CLAFUR5_13290 [Fulvia fulva]WPV21671.1 hypothetical protein CLAFUW4_13436 [Fulvia fulva]WPV35764.1 hypothetical protein CLAFUW7_13443 [Fulvia fulva]
MDISTSHVFDFPMPPSAPASPRSNRPSMPRRHTIVLKAEADDVSGPPAPARAPPPIPKQCEEIIFRNPWLQDRPVINESISAMFHPVMHLNSAPESKFSVDSSCWGEDHRRDSLALDEPRQSQSSSCAAECATSAGDSVTNDPRMRSHSHTTDYDVEDEMFFSTMQALLTMPPPPVDEDLTPTETLPILAPARSDFVEGLKFVLSGMSPAASGWPCP